MTTRRKGVLLAAVVGLTLALGACSSQSPANNSSDAASSEQITLTVSVFNDFGYEALYQEYMEANPNITIEELRAPAGTSAREVLQTHLAAGSGLSDIEAVEGDWMPEVMQYTDQWVDLSSPEVEGRWLDWKTAKATNADGQLLGYGTDSAPNAICYRADVFAAAGLPSDREEVAELLKGDWANFFAVGADFTTKSDVPWFDSSGSVFQGMISQLPNAFENNDGTPIPLSENAEMKAVYDAITATLETQSAHMQSWSDDWLASFQGDPKFATIMCPSWMAGFIEDQAAGTTSWDVAPVFPGGASNSGGSYLMVPAQSEHQEEAKKLAAWLTAPEQQIKAYQAMDVFPSQVEALNDPAVTGNVSEFFNNAPVGEIYASQAEAITVNPYTGEYYGTIRDIVGEALNRVDTGAMDAEASWQQALADYEDLGI